MRRRSLAVTTALVCTVMLLGGPTARTLRAAADADTTVAAGDLFGLNKVVAVHIEIPADEYQAMQPPIAGRRLRRTSAGSAAEKAGCQGERAEPFRDRVPLGARDVDGGGPDVQGRRLSLRRQRLVHGVGRRLEAFLQGRPGPRRPCRFQRPARGASPERRTRPDEGPRGPGLRPLPRGGRTRAAHGARRGDAHRPRPVRQGVPRPVHARRAGGSSVPQRSLPHRQGPALEAARAPRHRLPRRRLGEIQGPVPAAVRADARPRPSA